MSAKKKKPLTQEEADKIDEIITVILPTINS